MKKIILISLYLCTTSAFAVNNTTFITSNDTGAVVVNGKVIEYPKCIPKDATKEQKDEIQKKINQARKFSNAVPKTVNVCN